jgi:hypothetical protein
MSNATAQKRVPRFGLFEISGQGIIRHYQPANGAHEGHERGAAEELVGCNFYNEVAPPARAQELRERIVRFRRSGKPTESFDLALSPDGDDLTLRVMLTIIQERTADESIQSVLVHIRRADTYP